jgi:hypothetical protein
MDDLIQHLWVGSALSKLERSCASFSVYHGHALELFVYDDVGNVPAGVVLRDANEAVRER